MRYRFRNLVLTGLVSVVWLAGCRRVGPDYQTPATPTPDAWRQEVAGEINSEQPRLQAWWDYLNDPRLTELIRRARERNLTVRQAVSRIREARAARGATSRLLQPQVSGGASYTRTRSSEQAPPLSLLPEDMRNAQGFNLWAAGFDMAWELDVFGGLRRSIESADAAIDVSIEGYRDVLVTLFSEIALNYLEVRTLQERIRYSRYNIDLQEQTLGLAQARFDTGLAGRLDPTQAEANLAGTEAALPVLRQALQLSINRLGVLLSEQPGDLRESLKEPKPIPVPPDDLAVGIPANVVRQRPDIRFAERSLAAQTAQVGVATARLYPRFGLAGSLGLQATSLSSLGGAGTFGITPVISVPLFNRGRLRDLVRVEEERTQQALFTYEDTVLRAFAEVESALISYAEEQIRRDALIRSVDAAQRAADLVMVVYKTGLTDFQNVLDTQRLLALQQDQLAASEGQVTKNLVSLYKALGGGWDPAAPALGTAATPPADTAAATPNP